MHSPTKSSEARSSPTKPSAAIVQVAIASPLYRLFDYLPARGARASMHPPGSRVLVPFGKRKVVGVVVGHLQNSTLAPSQLKAIEQQLDAEPLLAPPALALARRLAEYYHHPLGDVLFNALPNALRKPGPAVAYSERRWRITPHGHGLPATALPRAPKQQALLNALRGAGSEGRSDAELELLGHSRQSALQLHKKALVEPHQRACLPDHCASILHGRGQQAALQLNPEQATALEQIEAARQDCATTLLEGVTGSGKTEVYLHAIEITLTAGQQALVLVPEIGLTPQTIDRFAARFACRIAVFHSGLTDRERLAAWLLVRSGEAGIIIGTRSAVFAPCPRPGLIIVDEEHDNSYKQQDGLRYSARDVAVMRGQSESVPVILGSATPSLETLLNARRGKYRHAKLQRRAGTALPPRIEFVDIRKLPLHEGLSDIAIQAIGDTLRRGRQAMVFINRRGFAPLLICHDCGWYAGCEHCDARLTLHQRVRELRCHHCDFRTAVPRACARCQSQQLLQVGQGTERSHAALAQLFPGTDIIRIDRDTTRGKQALQANLDRINERRPLIVVGTQMLAKGHHFSALDTVVMLDVDQGLYNPDFRGAEKTLQLMEQVSGRAGRGEQPGRVIIQTHLPDHALVKAWGERGFQGICNELLAEREARALPPYGFMAALRADSASPARALEFLQRVHREFDRDAGHDHSANNRVQCVGPMPALMERRGGRHRAQLLFNATQRKPLHYALARVLAIIAATRLPSGLRWSIDVDPQETV